MGVSENRGVPYFAVLIIRILLFRVPYLGSPYLRKLPCKGSICGLVGLWVVSGLGFLKSVLNKGLGTYEIIMLEALQRDLVQKGFWGGGSKVLKSTSV